jgi:hypothetical protein
MPRVAQTAGRKHFFSEEKKQKTFIFQPLPSYPAMAWIYAPAHR